MNSTRFSCFNWDAAKASLRNSILASLLLIFLMATFLVSLGFFVWSAAKRHPSKTSPNAPDPESNTYWHTCNWVLEASPVDSPSPREFSVSPLHSALCTIFTILLTLWNSEQKNGLLIKLSCFSSDFDETWWSCSYNFTKFYQNHVKNKKVLLIARFSDQNFKVSVESWKSYIVPPLRAKKADCPFS